MANSGIRFNFYAFQDYDWPMQGYILPHAPKLQIHEKKNELSGSKFILFLVRQFLFSDWFRASHMVIVYTPTKCSNAQHLVEY